MLELSCEGDFRHAATFHKSFGGDTFNTAVAARRLGSEVAYITRIGNDDFSHALHELMLRENIHLPNPHPVRAQTGLYFVSVDAGGNRQFNYYRTNSASTHLGPTDIPEALIKSAKIVFASGIGMAISKSCRQATVKAFKIARENEVMTAFDPNYRSALWGGDVEALDALNEILPYTDIILPTCPDDTEEIIGFKKPDQVIDYFLFKGVKLVAVKAGADGCYLGYKKEVTHIPAMRVKPVDTTAAGDAFNGGFLHGLAAAHSLTDCAKLGVTAAGLKVLNRGSAVAMPNKDAVYSRAFSS